MCTSPDTQPAAASLEEASSARLATSANSTRSTRGSRRRPVRSLLSTLSMPSRCHMPSSTCAPPSGRDASKVSSELAVTRNAAAGPAAGTGRRSAVGSRPGRPGRSGRSCRGSWCATPAPPRPTGCGPAAGTTPACRSCSAAAPPARTCPRHYQYHHRLNNMCCPIRVLGVHSAWRQPQSSDLRPYPGTCPRPALNCGTQVSCEPLLEAVTLDPERLGGPWARANAHSHRHPRHILGPVTDPDDGWSGHMVCDDDGTGDPFVDDPRG